MAIPMDPIIGADVGFIRSMTDGWLSDLGDVPIATLIQERSGHPVFVDNDVNALTLGEWTFGAGRGAASLVTVAIGTGIGGGVILDGRRDTVRGGAALVLYEMARRRQDV